MHHIDPAEAATDIGADDPSNDTGLEMLGWLLIVLIAVVAVGGAMVIWHAFF